MKQLIQIFEGPKVNPTQEEKIEFFHNRTNKHKALVEKYVKIIVEKYPEYRQVIEIAKNHDNSKFEEPEYTPYIDLTWNKFHNGIDSNPYFNQATLHHILNNPHHPEYWNPDEANVNPKNRDESLKSINVSEMSDESIVEMVADWAAMSEELGQNNPRGWYDKCNNVRWTFSDEQNTLIDKLLSAIEENKLNEDTSYRGQHQITNGRLAYNLTNLKDIIKQLKFKNGYLTNYDLKDLRLLEKMQNNPDMDIVVYRASPVHELNDGDWVTTSKVYAIDIKNQNGGKVFSYLVKAKNLIYPDDLDELPSLARFSAFKYRSDLIEASINNKLDEKGEDLSNLMENLDRRIKETYQIRESSSVENIQILSTEGIPPDGIRQATFSVKNKTGKVYKYVAEASPYIFKIFLQQISKGFFGRAMNTISPFIINYNENLV